MSSQIDRHGIACDFRSDAEPAEHFDREQPRFKGPVLPAEDGTPFTRNGEWLPGLCGPDNGQRVRLDWKLLERVEPGRWLSRPGGIAAGSQ